MKSTLTRAVTPGVVASSKPKAKLAPMVGMEFWGGLSVPKTASVRPWNPSLKMIAALAPAAAAFATFSSKVQVPRTMSAIAPAGKPAKSAASQPLVEVPAVIGMPASTGSTEAVTSPFPE
jgi:hypothetical protein